MLVVRVTGDGIARLTRAADSLSQTDKARKAYQNALNEVGNDAFKEVKTAISKQTGLPVKLLVRKAGFRPIKATRSNLEYRIFGAGYALPLKYFKAKQFSYGVRASPWGGNPPIFNRPFS